MGSAISQKEMMTIKCVFDVDDEICFALNKKECENCKFFKSASNHKIKKEWRGSIKHYYVIELKYNGNINKE